MRLLLGSILALAVAALVGLGTTWLTLSRGTAFGAVPIGAWTAWPKTGTRDVDPYARATISRSGELPVGSGDGVAFMARTDDNGRGLDGRCDVRISGTTPQARFWTLTLYDPQGRLIGNAIDRQGFTSQEIVRNADGSFDVVAAPAHARRKLAADQRRGELHPGDTALRYAGRRRHARGTRGADACDPAVLLVRTRR